MATTRLDPHSHSGADGERLVYTCTECGVVYDAAPGEPAPECDCDKATYTYTIWDTGIGDRTWPTCTRVPVEGTADEALQIACVQAQTIGASCGEYDDGDSVTVRVDDARGNSVAQVEVILEIDSTQDDED